MEDKRNEKKFFFLIMAMLFVSCNRTDENSTVRIWCYEQISDNKLYNVPIEKSLDKMTEYARKNNINLEIKKYSQDTLSYEDYILKRNAAIESGDVDILFDTADNLYNLRNKSGDYTKLETYENIIDSMTGYYCIPIDYFTIAKIMNNKVLKHYGISCDNVITEDEYYKIKQQLKDLGARFDFTLFELKELIYAHCRKNNVQLIKENKKYTLNKDLLKKSIEEIYCNLTDNYGVTSIDDEETVFESNVYEKTSGLPFSTVNILSSHDIYWFRRELPKEFTDYIVIITDELEYKDIIIPCIFINGITDKEDAFRLVSLLFTPEFQIDLKIKHRIGIMPVIDTSEVKEAFGFDSNWKCIREFETNTQKDAVQLYDMKDKAYEQLLTKDNSHFFTDLKRENAIETYIYSELKLLVEDPSLFYELDKRIDDFIINLNVYNN